MRIKKWGWVPRVPVLPHVLVWAILLYCFQPTSLYSQVNISLLYDTTYTETCRSFDCEAYNLKRTFEELSFQVDTISETDPQSIADAVNCNQIFVIPETEKGDLAVNLDSLSKLEIRSYVSNGGSLLIFGSEGSNLGSSTAADNLNAIFDFDISDGGFAQSGNSQLNSSNADGTSFESGPVNLPNLITTNFIEEGLPPDAIPIYETNGESSVVIIPYGDGKIIFIGWSWFSGGPGQSQDGSAWETILQFAINELDPREITVSCAPDTEVNCSTDYSPQGPNTIIENIPLLEPIGPDSGDVISIPVTINTGFASSRLGDVDLFIKLRHGDFSDVEIRLISPEGTARDLWIEECPGELFINAYLDDEGLPFKCGDGEINGAIRPPDSNLQGFKGEDPSGIWTVEIRDVRDQNAGILEAIGLRVEELAPLSFPEISDACLLDTLFYEDLPVVDSCGLGIINRTWTAAAQGTEFSCVQTIEIEPGSEPEIEFPENISFSCDEIPESFHPDSIVVNGSWPVNINDDFCGLLDYAFEDQVIDECPPHGYIIRRVWTVRDGCVDDFEATKMQIIRVLDTTIPEIPNCPRDSIYLVDGDDCDVFIQLDQPSGIDNCDGNPEMLPPVIRNDDGDVVNLPVGAGSYTVEYSARDNCGNVGNCIQQITVVDLVDPVAVARDTIDKVLGFNGSINVCAQELNDGSSDNCKIENLRLSKDGVNFGTCITFGCQDLDDSPIPVYLKVWDLSGNTDETMAWVRLRDTLTPILLCPQDATVDCSEDPPFTSAGEASVSHSCDNFTISYSDTDLGSCNTGDIIRTWEMNAPLTSTTCKQKITVVDITPPSFSIPADISLSCDNANVSPALTGMLEFADDCSDYLITSSDRRIDICLPGNYVIERTWKAENACNSQDSYEFLQNIYVLDQEAPTMSSLPDQLIIEVDTFDCFAILDIPDVTLSDNCDPDPDLEVMITDSLGNTYLPGETVIAGTYTVTYVAKDACDNEQTKTVSIIVRDNVLPKARCKFNLSVSITVAENVIVFAEQLDDGSTDNCTGSDDLSLYLENREGIPGLQDFLVFNCNDLGDHPVRLFVVDEHGNSSTCDANIEVVDNLNICEPPPNTVNIGGEVYTEVDDRVEDVRVSIDPGIIPPVRTNALGRFSFSEVPTGQGYTLTPAKNDEWLNGVSTYDILLIRRHILNVERLNSPLKMIAADANRSGNISTIDITMIRQLILHLIDTIPNNTSWRFVPAQFNFPDPEDPFSTTFPEQLNINNVIQPNLDLDFYGIKIGDVNSSFVPGSNVTGGTEREDVTTSLSLPEFHLEAGRSARIPVYWDQVNDFATLQFTLAFDRSLIEVEHIESGYLEVTGSTGDRYRDEGLFTLAWVRPDFMPAGDPIFYLNINARANTDIDRAIQINSAKTKAVAYFPDGNTAVPVLESRGQTTSVNDANKTFNITARPNPFNNQTLLSFSLERASDIALQIFDSKGQKVFDRNAYLNQGSHHWELGPEVFPVAGVYTCRFRVGEGQQILRLIALP